ncbi:unnamed protein product, partial [Mesorhabditis spiculigera]
MSSRLVMIERLKRMSDEDWERSLLCRKLAKMEDIPEAQPVDVQISEDEEEPEVDRVGRENGHDMEAFWAAHRRLGPTCGQPTNYDKTPASSDSGSWSEDWNASPDSSVDPVYERDYEGDDEYEDDE